MNGTFRNSQSIAVLSDEVLGNPMTIGQVAALLGCSVWTVRQQYLPQGLPCLRTGTSGKFVFFREQVVRWVLKRQASGGNTGKEK